MEILTNSSDCRKLGTKFRIIYISEILDDDSRGHSNSDSLKRNNKEVRRYIRISLGNIFFHFLHLQEAAVVTTITEDKETSFSISQQSKDSKIISANGEKC